MACSLDLARLLNLPYEMTTASVLASAAAGLLLVSAAGQLRAASPKHPDREETVVVYRNKQSFFDIAGWPDDEIGAVADVHIHQHPARGEVRVDLREQAFIFYPDVDLCSAADEFIYTVKYGDWMETYRINVEIVCDAPTIIAQFTVGQDGNNVDYDAFTILGVQAFPNNSLAVFDRSGNPIFRQDNYANDWRGLLPDGTLAKKEDEFLYVFDDGNGNLYSGYVRIN